MPELPEVKTVIKHLKKYLINFLIINVNIYQGKLIKEILPQEFKQQIINQKILNIENKGKFIVFHLTNDLVMLSHLRLEGKYRIKNDLKNLNKNDVLSFELNNKMFLIYNDTRLFGTFHLRNKNNWNKISPIANVGPEPFEIDAKTLWNLINKKGIAIKTVLLDQSILAGLGNIYVNEVLWEAKINPERKAKNVSLEEVENILEISKRILHLSTKLGGSTIKSFNSFGSIEGTYQKHLKVHGKMNEKCFKCLNIISKKQVNGRGTYYCSICQAI